MTQTTERNLIDALHEGIARAWSKYGRRPSRIVMGPDMRHELIRQSEPFLFNRDIISGAERFEGVPYITDNDLLGASPILEYDPGDGGYEGFRATLFREEPEEPQKQHAPNDPVEVKELKPKCHKCRLSFLPDGGIMCMDRIDDEYRFYHPGCLPAGVDRTATALTLPNVPLLLR